MSDLTDDDKTYELLREKIKSKMDVTKFFSGFVSVVFGIILKDIVSGINGADSGWLFAGMCLIVFSLSAAIVALFAYDRLLMPPKFFSGGDRIEAINNSLRFHMVRTWVAMFVPAVIAFLGALVAFATAQVTADLPFPLWLGFGGAALAAFLLYVCFKAPFEIPD